MNKYLINNLIELENLAKEFSEKLTGGEIILLNGDLGVGKTTFVQFVANCLGVSDDVTSPTFTILKSYNGNNLTMNHFDMYRIEDISEVYEFGFEDYLQHDKNSVTFIEWAERVADLLPADCIKIGIKIIDENKREIVIEGVK